MLKHEPEKKTRPSCYPLFLPHHNGCFFGFLSKKYLRQISILGTNNISKCTFVMSILKVIYYLVQSYLVPFFQISYLLVLRFVFNTFWTKISNSSHCAVIMAFRGPRDRRRLMDQKVRIEI